MELADYSAGNLFITGELGSGKTMYAVKLIREYLQAGRPVATNLDLFLDEMLPETSRATVTRLPDKPQRLHFDSLGDAYSVKDGYTEDKFGLIVLDECLTWLNSRGWQDKERAPVLDWFLHARKHGWNVAFLMQSADFCDPQLRETLLTYHVACRKMSKYRIPVVGKMLGMRLPKGTLATVFAGYGPNSIKHDSELYRGSDLYNSYKTDQIFNDGFELCYGPVDKFGERSSSLVQFRCSYTILSAWHIKGRYENVKIEYVSEPFHIALTYFILNLIVRFTVKPIFTILFAIPAFREHCRKDQQRQSRQLLNYRV